MLGSVVSGIVSTVIGLYASFHADVAAGPAIVLSAVGIFTLAYLVSPRGLRGGQRSGRRSVAK